MKRNPEATCATCPYVKLNWMTWDGSEEKEISDGKCRVEHIPQHISDPEGYWCGQHPDFFLGDDA